MRGREGGGGGEIDYRCYAMEDRKGSFEWEGRGDRGGGSESVDGSIIADSNAKFSNIDVYVTGQGLGVRVEDFGRTPFLPCERASVGLACAL